MNSKVAIILRIIATSLESGELGGNTIDAEGLRTISNEIEAAFTRQNLSLEQEFATTAVKLAEQLAVKKEDAGRNYFEFDEHALLIFSSSMRESNPNWRKDAGDLLHEAKELIRIALSALLKMGLSGRGSDCSLSHEVRRFAYHFSPEERDGPGILQVRGDGRANKWLRAVIAAQTGAGSKK